MVPEADNRNPLLDAQHVTVDSESTIRFLPDIFEDVFNIENYPGKLEVTGNLNIKSRGIVEGRRLNIKADTVSVDDGGKIDLDGKGHDTGSGPGKSVKILLSV